MTAATDTQDTETSGQVAPVVRLVVPIAAYRLHEWQLAAWEKQQRSHPEWLQFEVVRGDCGGWDGYILGSDVCATAYILGWLVGRDSKNQDL